MSPARLRRLQADHARVSQVFSAHPYIRLVAAEGEPPEKYTFQFDLPSIIPANADHHALGNTHRAEVFLPMDYPPPAAVLPDDHPGLPSQHRSGQDLHRRSLEPPANRWRI